MPDMALIAGTMTSLKTAFDMSKTIIGIRDAAILNEKVIELQRVILAAQSDAMAAQAEQLTLLERVSGLEKQITDMKAWETEKQRYELKAATSTAFIYALKTNAGGTEPPHWLCAACYEKGVKSILSVYGSLGRNDIWKCPSCTATFSILRNIVPTR
jgi:rubrerythrin